jgi:Putative zinc dependent peptidase (DUF5700)
VKSPHGTALAVAALLAVSCATGSGGRNAPAPPAPAAPRSAHAGPVRGAALPLATRDISLDLSPAAGVLAIWASGDRRPGAARSVASGLAYRTLQENLGGPYGCPTTRLELQRALANPDSGICGFGLVPAWRARASIDSLVRAIKSDRAGIVERLAARAGAYLPAAPRRPIRYWFLLASAFTFDAITLDSSVDGDSLPVVIVNLTDVLSYAGDTPGRMAALEHTLAHEAFHAVLHQIRRIEPEWVEFRSGPLIGVRHVAEVMVDEGVAHYVDQKDRPGADTLFTARPGGRERFAFSQLAIACRRFRQTSPGSPQWWETLQLASSGPLWSKYGAISGMFAAFRIERAAGRDSLIRAIRRGPPEFLRLYGEVAGADTSLAPLPGDLATLE